MTAIITYSMDKLSALKDQVAKEFGYKDFKTCKKQVFISNQLENAVDRLVYLSVQEARDEILKENPTGGNYERGTWIEPGLLNAMPLPFNDSHAQEK